MRFGSFWTEAKLNAIENYLSAYTIALKKKNYKLCYIDAFAGDGSVVIKDGNEIEGSSLRALKYPFDKFYFFEKDPYNIEKLKLKIETISQKNIELHCGDCNDFLLQLCSLPWRKDNWRGIIFLDPYAMHLEWKSLEVISKTKVFDVWYLFPFMAVNRNFYRNGKIPIANKRRLDTILGTHNWQNEIYKDSPQLSFLDDKICQKLDMESIKSYIIKRLKNTFPTVADNAVFFRNEKLSPMFLLCFAGSNPSKAARELSLKIADHILSHI
ncbi:MAG TPA: three-Cys-motif partner protein TcmP [Dehalococcoidales bacterium]|nr:three-Cys-motif partner protein TcmP [Dehalococcoidales bacterium]